MDTLNSAIEQYLNRGFGSMNKNDFEVFIFNELLRSQHYSGFSDYQFSRELKVPQAKIKRLRYEADLVYGGRKDEEYNREFLELLKNAKPKPTNMNRIQFAMEDKGLYLFIDNKLKEGGHFSDRSHNGEIIEISIDDLTYLLEKCLFDENEKQKIIRDYTAKTKKKSTFHDIIIEAVNGFANGLGNTTGIAAWTFTTANIAKLW